MPLSLKSEEKSPIADPKNFELTGILWGAKEIGAKDCQATGEDLPKSIDSWFKAVSNYSQSEKVRDDKLNADVEVLKKKIAEIEADKTTKDMQVESLQFQIDSLNLNIESVKGANGRIPLREKLLLAIQKSLDFTKKENQKKYSAYKTDLILKGFDESTKVAQSACERKKIIETCDEVDNNKTCSTEEVSDPVLGCDVALKIIPLIYSGPAQAYGDIYLVKKIASKELNEKMNNFENVMFEMNKGIPKSSDNQFDWTSPIFNGLAKTGEARKETGVICPSSEEINKKNKKNEDILKKAKTFLEILGVPAKDIKKSIDVFIESWNEADLVIGQAGQRPSYFEKIEKLLKELIKNDQEKLGNLQTELEALTGNLKKVQKELGIKSNGKCPPSPIPGGIRICGGEYSVWCDPKTVEGKSYDAYIACMRPGSNSANQTSESSVSNFIKNHPDFVGVVQNSEGKWVAKMKKPDGTIYYVDKSYDGVPVSAESCGPYPLPMGSFCLLGNLEKSSPHCDPTTPEGKEWAAWSSCNSLVLTTNALECIPEYVGPVVVKACPAPGSTGGSATAPVVSGGTAGAGGSSSGSSSSGKSTGSVNSESEGGKLLSGEPSTSAGYAKAFSPEELGIYKKVPNKTNYNFSDNTSSPTSISFTSKIKSIEVCKNVSGVKSCSQDSEGTTTGRTAMGAFAANKSQEFIHRMSFTFKTENYFASNPLGYFAFGLRGDLRNINQGSLEAGADGRGVIIGNLVGDKRNSGYVKCGNRTAEIQSFSSDAFAKGLSPRASEIFPKTCSGQVLQDNTNYKVEIDVTKSNYIFYRIYNESGILVQKSFIQDPANSRIDQSLTGWFVAHVSDATVDKKDNDGDGMVDNELVNWSFNIDNLKMSSGSPKP